MTKSKGWLHLIGVIILIAAITVMAVIGVGSDQSGSLYDIKLGLDLAGGVSITYQVVGDETPDSKDLEDTKAKLEMRAQMYSTESEVYIEGTNRINVDIPDVKDANAILEELGTPGTLYFIKQKNDDGADNYSYTATGYTLNFTIDKLIENGSVILTGNDIATAAPASQKDQTYGTTDYVVTLSLNSDGTKKFDEATQYALDNSQTIAIYYDGNVISAPRVSAHITDGNAIISGQDSWEEADKLATIIRIGAVPLELEEIRSNVVGAKLGESAIHTSLIAGAIGLAAIVIFMIVFYRLMGAASALSLLFYTALEIVVISSFDVTLTLPGIAGIILSIGMAVDANVIIFERIKEEIGAGASVRLAVQNGFSKALSAILDGNITTLIVAAVLFIVGTGTIKGFAQTLAIGIIISMITALFVTKFILNAFIALGIRDKKYYGETKKVKVLNYTGRKKIFFAISSVAIIASIVIMSVNASKGYMLNYSIDFIGGTSSTIALDKTMTLAEIDSEVKPVVAEALGITEADIRANTVNDKNEIVLKTKTLSQEEREKMLSALEEKLGVAEDSVEMDNISATIGNEMRRNAFISIALATLFMLLYIWIRFKNLGFGLGAVLALIHDVMIVLLFYAALRWSVGTTFIACVLTIVGYSINATIVVFDRIRENLKAKEKKDTLADVVNKSISQTFTRSVNTSLTTLVTVVILAIMGVSSIREFAYPLIVGIVCGTYSSVCIAGNLWYVFAMKAAKKAESK